MLINNLFVSTKEKNVSYYHLINTQGSRIEIERGRTYCWIEMVSVDGKTITYGFTVDDFDNDRIEFNLCINQIVNDCFQDGYYNLF